MSFTFLIHCRDVNLTLSWLLTIKGQNEIQSSPSTCYSPVWETMFQSLFWTSLPFQAIQTSILMSEFLQDAEEQLNQLYKQWHLCRAKLSEVTLTIRQSHQHSHTRSLQYTCLLVHNVSHLFICIYFNNAIALSFHLKKKKERFSGAKSQWLIVQMGKTQICLMTYWNKWTGKSRPVAIISILEYQSNWHMK